MRKVLVFTLFAVALGSSTATMAGVIAVANPSFESDALSPGNSKLGATGWTATAASGTFAPLIGTHVNSIPDGSQVGFVGDTQQGGPLYLAQDVGAVNVGDTYQLSVYVGSRLDGGGYPSHYEVELIAGSINNLPSATVLGSQTGTVNPGTGDFSLVTVNGVGAGTGDLIILLEQLDVGQTLFDKVLLTAQSPGTTPVPEPATIAMLMGAIPVIVVSVRRMRKTA